MALRSRDRLPYAYASIALHTNTFRARRTICAPRPMKALRAARRIARRRLAKHKATRWQELSNQLGILSFISRTRMKALQWTPLVEKQNSQSTKLRKINFSDFIVFHSESFNYFYTLPPQKETTFKTLSETSNFVAESRYFYLVITWNNIVSKYSCICSRPQQSFAYWGRNLLSWLAVVFSSRGSNLWQVSWSLFSLLAARVYHHKHLQELQRKTGNLKISLNYIILSHFEQPPFRRKA